MKKQVRPIQTIRQLALRRLEENSKRCERDLYRSAVILGDYVGQFVVAAGVDKYNRRNGIPVVVLPRGYIVALPDSDMNWTMLFGPDGSAINCTSQNVNREAVQRLISDVEDGWIDELATYLGVIPGLPAANHY